MKLLPFQISPSRMAVNECLDNVKRFIIGYSYEIGDFSDRLNRKWTVFILITNSFIVALKTYFLKPISCYLPITIGESGGIVDFMEHLCWTEGSIPYYNSSQGLPNNEADWIEAEKHKINYYQWVPILFGCQCLLLYIPYSLWKYLCLEYVGVDVDELVKTALAASRMAEENIKPVISCLCRTMEKNGIQRLKYHEKVINCGHQLIHYQLRNRIFSSYLITKIIYFFIILLQIYLMHLFLNDTSVFFGWQLLVNSLSGNDNSQSQKVFPLIGFCRSSISTVASLPIVTAQCTLPVNLVILNICIFLWFWLVILSISCFISFIEWIIWMNNYERKYQNYLPDYDDGSDVMVDRRFVSDFIGIDGAFIMRMIEMRANEMITRNVIQHLYANVYLKRYNNCTFLYNTSVV